MLPTFESKAFSCLHIEYNLIITAVNLKFNKKQRDENESEEKRKREEKVVERLIVVF